MKNLKKTFLNPAFLAAILICSSFSLIVFAFTNPPSGCSPGTCVSPLDVDFENQAVSVSSAPTANEHVANKEYVDATVSASGIQPGWVGGDLTFLGTASWSGTSTTDYVLGTLPSSAKELVWCSNINTLTATCSVAIISEAAMEYPNDTVTILSSGVTPERVLLVWGGSGSDKVKINPNSVSIGTCYNDAGNSVSYYHNVYIKGNGSVSAQRTYCSTNWNNVQSAINVFYR